MKILFTTQGTDWSAPMDPRFGRAKYFFVYDDNIDKVTIVENSDSAAEAHGAGPKAVSKIADLQVDIIITGNGPGDNAWQALKALNVKVFTGAGNLTVEEAYNKFQKGELNEFGG